ncbi:alpha/beta fold hydrolase [Propioniciclava tarda]|mgnify:CR=1 FL=1|uniref:Alpha/beta hydrolase n=1 Tax=Propioniciclava tarda TaxID=433330 RepID=A0A4Q9KKW2_PROTD|nr:alpha/beta hydrolase [Propioniciclava tarda]TBT94994.1 alpha/beta hydrolase [Propioniciclava tarda]SMO57295.1 Pimeloyl-ACP methyl ester carboxylesterase [Propioniciclava tarda]HOA89034.1 alpha/beta hydrolase [Propioniciclava tarda]HQA31126.1 alpha/beta hydrolase [Propioniciclava tarda]HQD60251.1 alpha/beta hydrolase [Propioniciclava tarda]
MPEFTIPGDTPVTLHYTDSGGEGRPVVLIHGWPLSGRAWDANVGALTELGHRVITYDRRGFGQSSKPEDGYDYDTLASDLNDLLTELDLHRAILVGFSMGAGEVARYLGTYGGGRLAGAVLAAGITPGLGITDANPNGAGPQEFFDGLADQCAADREGFLDGFMHTFFSTPTGQKVPEEEVQKALAIAAQGSHTALPACIRIWSTDFQEDLRDCPVPLLVIHGDGDQNVPFEKSAARIHEYAPNAFLDRIPDGPHGINVSDADRFNASLAYFIDRM